MGLLNYTIAKVNELLKKVADMPEKISDGKTPVLETGETTTLPAGDNATSEVVANGEDTNGNPRYKINLGIPRGKDGAGGSGGGGVADSVDWGKVLNKPSWVNSPTKPTYTASETGALPATTQIPSKVSQLANDAKFIKESDLKTVNGQSLIGAGNITVSGGGGGGTGNVNITNANGLRKGWIYAFSPSADGSTDGTFSALGNASDTASGLMPSADHKKLAGMKEAIALPAAVMSLTPASASADIIAAFGSDFSSNDGIASIAVVFSSIQAADYSASVPSLLIGNHDCSVNAAFDNEASTATLELTYVAPGGKLCVIRILCKQADGVWAYSCETEESGEDTYYLPIGVTYLSESATHDEILKAFGGEEGVANLKAAIKGKKKIYVWAKISIIYYLFPVSVSCVGVVSLCFDNPNLETRSLIVLKTGSGSSAKRYPLETYTPYVIDLDLLDTLKGVDATTQRQYLGKAYETVTEDNILSLLGGKGQLPEIARAFQENRLEVYAPAQMLYAYGKEKGRMAACMKTDTDLMLQVVFANTDDGSTSFYILQITALDTDTPKATISKSS